MQFKKVQNGFLIRLIKGEEIIAAGFDVGVTAGRKLDGPGADNPYDNYKRAHLFHTATSIPG